MGWLAALLAAGACAAAGYGAKAKLEKPETLRRGAGERIELLKCLAERIETCPAQAPEEAVARLPWDSLFTASEQETLADCLLSLFSPDPETQLRALRYVRSQWVADCRAARASREKNGGLYASLGWLAGAGVFILLC